MSDYFDSINRRVRETVTAEVLTVRNPWGEDGIRVSWTGDNGIERNVHGYREGGMTAVEANAWVDDADSQTRRWAHYDIGSVSADALDDDGLRELVDTAVARVDSVSDDDLTTDTLRPASAELEADE